MPNKIPNKKNNGFSMVEVLIAIAILAILLIPITSGIIRSMNRTTDAKTLQYRNEFAENVMEYIKEDSLENILKGGYLKSVGSYVDGDTSNAAIKATATFHKEIGKPLANSLDFADILSKGKYLTYNVIDTDINNNEYGDALVTYPYEEYWLSGNVKLGTKHDTYAYKMLISNKSYAKKEADAAIASQVFVNPNNLALGVVEDIDYNKIALINGTIANYDSAVSNAFLTKKLEVLKEVDPDWYELYTTQAEAPVLFPDDTATRQIIIKVTGSAETGYKVTCSLDYKDNGGTANRANVKAKLDAENFHIEYTPFEFSYDADNDYEEWVSDNNPDDATAGHFETKKRAELPNIYLMYNVCLYNDMFSPDDYIVIDTSGVTDGTEVNCYIVQTAERYSSNLTDANEDLADLNSAMQDNEDNGLPNSKLYNNKTSGNGVDRREDVKVHLAATKGSDLANLNVYHNFDVTGTNSDVNRKSSKVYYNNTQSNALGSLSASYYKELVTYDASGKVDTANSVKNFKSLNEAEEESRGLYEVSIWIEEGDDPSAIDTDKSPTMSATKGGDES